MCFVRSCIKLRIVSPCVSFSYNNDNNNDNKWYGEKLVSPREGRTIVVCEKEFGKRKNRRILHIRAYWFNAGILSFDIAAERMNYAIMRAKKKIGFFCSSRIRGTSIKWPVDFSVVFPIFFCSIVTRRHFSPNGNPSSLHEKETTLNNKTKQNPLLFQIMDYEIKLCNVWCCRREIYTLKLYMYFLFIFAFWNIYEDKIWLKLKKKKFSSEDTDTRYTVFFET